MTSGPQQNLNRGMEGDAVANLQRRLQRLNFTIADPEIQAKRFGPTTEAAVRAFQEREGLESTGVVNRITRQRLQAAINDLNPPTPDPSPEEETPEPAHTV